MKRHQLFSKMKKGLQLTLLSSLGLFGAHKASAVGYIYLHLKATSESKCNATDSFQFMTNVPGYGNISLNDRYDPYTILDFSASAQGDLFAIVSDAAGTGRLLMWRPVGTSKWQLIQSNSGLKKVRGGAGHNCFIMISTVSRGYLWDPVNGFVDMGGAPIGSLNDIAFDKTANRIWYRNASTTYYGAHLWYREMSGNTATGNWSELGFPTNPAYTQNTIEAGYNCIMYPNTANGTIRVQNVIQNSGFNIPTTSIYGYSMTGDLYARYSLNVNRWKYGTAGFSEMPEGPNGTNEFITDGPLGQLWAGYVSGIFPSATRSDGTTTFIDNEIVTQSPNGMGNSVLIPVNAGTYSILQSAFPTSNSWQNVKIEVMDPTNNSSSVVAGTGGSASINVSDGEIVHVTFGDAVVSPTAMINDCSQSSFLETFGSNPTVGAQSPDQGGIGANGGMFGYTALHRGGAAGMYWITNSFPIWNVRDHSSTDTTGNCVIVNGAYQKDIVYSRTLTNLIPGRTYTCSYWVQNATGGAGFVVPNLKIAAVDTATGAELAVKESGPITAVNIWQQQTFSFVSTQPTMNLVIRNNSGGAAGNDFAIDDIEFRLSAAAPAQIDLQAANCSSPAQVTITSPTGTGLEYSIDSGATYQSSPVFANMAMGTYHIFTRYTTGNNCGSTERIVTVDPFICGNIYNDANGLSDNNVNGTLISTASAAQLYINVFDTAGHFISSTPVKADGSFSVSAPMSSTNVLILSSTQCTNAIITAGGTQASTTTLPSGWTYTGENLTAGTGSDNGANGALRVVMNTAAITGVKLGIERLPESDNKNTSIAQPLPNQSITLNGMSGNPPFLTGSDPDDQPASGTLSTKKVAITALPANQELYYNNGSGPVHITVGQDGVNPPSPSNPFVISSFNPSNLSIKLTGMGDTATSFNYAYIDAAGKQDPTPATYRLEWNNPLGTPNLAPTISFLPSSIIGTQNVNVVVNVYEFNDVATSGPITVYIPKNTSYTLTYNPAATILSGQSLQNSAWTFDGTSNPFFYIMTTNSVIAASGASSFGFSTTFNPNNQSGNTQISAIITDLSGGELESFNTDNADDDNLDFSF